MSILMQESFCWWQCSVSCSIPLPRLLGFRSQLVHLWRLPGVKQVNPFQRPWRKWAGITWAGRAPREILPPLRLQCERVERVKSKDRKSPTGPGVSLSWILVELAVFSFRMKVSFCVLMQHFKSSTLVSANNGIWSWLFITFNCVN